MNLRDGVLGVRNRLGELKPWLYSDSDIVKDLNRSANNICTEAEILRLTYQSETAAPVTQEDGSQKGTQEYVMPLEVNRLIQVKVQIGILMPIVWSSQENIQIGAYVSALPLAGYVRYGTLLTGMIPAQPATPPTTPGSTEQILPPPGTANVPRWIVGFYPVPAAVYPFFVDYYAYHPAMNQPMDYVMLPDTASCFDTWVAYAVSKGFEKRGDFVSAQYYLKQHKDGIEEIKQKKLLDNWEINPGQYGGLQGNPLFRGGPSVLVIPPTNPQVNF